MAVVESEMKLEKETKSCKVYHPKEGRKKNSEHVLFSQRVVQEVEKSLPLDLNGSFVIVVLFCQK